MHGVYVLSSEKDGNLYVGYSRDIKGRLAAHNSGRVPATRDRRPMKLVYCEMFASQKDAMRREIYLKTGWGRNYLKRTLTDTLRSKI